MLGVPDRGAVGLSVVTAAIAPLLCGFMIGDVGAGGGAAAGRAVAVAAHAVFAPADPRRGGGDRITRLEGVADDAF